MTDLPYLIQQLEAAPQGTSRLDRKIFHATHPHQGTYGNDDEWHYATHLDADGGPWAIGPRYTTSVDDAMTLIPTGYRYGLCWSPQYGVEAWVYDNNGGCHQGFAVEGDMTDKTRAKALCIAALYARSTSQ